MLGVKDFAIRSGELAPEAGARSRWERFVRRLKSRGLRGRRRGLEAAVQYPVRLLGLISWVTLIAVLTGSAVGVDLTVEQLKAKVASASAGDKPHLCVQIAERQLDATDKLYAAVEVDKAQAAMADVVAFSELARDYAIQSHKYQKQTEIAVRTMSRKLADIKHLAAHDDQAPIQDAINRLQRVRDDLLVAMFPKGAK